MPYLNAHCRVSLQARFFFAGHNLRERYSHYIKATREFNPFGAKTFNLTSESDVHRSQILTSQVDPRSKVTR